MELLRNNYIEHAGYGDEWKIIRLDPPRRKVKTYYLETVEAAEYLHANKQGKFQVLLSGGLDSLYICHVLLKLGMSFDPILVVLKNANGEVYNRHELKFAYEFCEAFNVKPIIYDINYDDFVISGKLLEVTEETTCSSLAMNTTMHVLKSLDGFSIVGNADPVLHLEDAEWMIWDPEFTMSLLRYYRTFNLNGCPYFMQFSSEMLLAWLLEPSIKELVSGKFPGKTGSNSTKASVYNNGSGFNLQSYEYSWMGIAPYDPAVHRVKLTGYELIYKSKLMEHPAMKLWITKYRNKWNGNIMAPYTELVKKLSIHE